MLDSQNILSALEENFDAYGPISIGFEKEENSLSLTKKLYRHYLGEITSLETHLDELTKVRLIIECTMPLQMH